MNLIITEFILNKVLFYKTDDINFKPKELQIVDFFINIITLILIIILYFVLYLYCIVLHNHILVKYELIFELFVVIFIYSI